MTSLLMATMGICWSASRSAVQLVLLHHVNGWCVDIVAFRTPGWPERHWLRSDHWCYFFELAAALILCASAEAAWAVSDSV